MRSKKRHMIGNAHLDPVWLWQWQEGFQEVKATLRSALDRLKEYEDFVFTSSTAAMYEWIEYNEPKMFEEIKVRITEGRWVLCGGWWVQSDCNLPSGESFVRQGLYGQRYFQEKFGVMSSVGYNVDSFGHHAMLPQLLKKSRMDYYVFMRPKKNEKHLDTNLFWWESVDGTRVLTYRIFDYSQFTGNIEAPLLYQIHQRELEDPELDGHMFFYGVGNHGGGPTKKNIETIQELKGSDSSADFIFSSPNRFFESIKEREMIPVFRDELQMHAKGCYSAHSAVKRWNRKAENLLVTAEKWAVTARHITGQSYPDNMKQAWKNVLFNQFHDILPGSSIEEVYEQDTRDGYGEANSIAGRGLNNAIQSISWNIRFEWEEGMKPIVVFNPHSWGTKVNVELEFGHFGEGREFHSFTDANILVDEAGNQLLIQQVKSHSTTIWRQRLTFVAELPPLGYRTYRVVSKDSFEQSNKHAHKSGLKPLTALSPASLPYLQIPSNHILENGHFRLELNPNSGFIASLYDKKKKFEVFRGEAARLVVIEDFSDTWSHGIERFDKEIGEFEVIRIRNIEHGSVKSVIRVESKYGKSMVTQDFTMYYELNHIEVNVTVDWHEQFKMLKLRFPVNVNSNRTTYEIPYGHIERENNGSEVPGISWFDQSGSANGTDFSYGLSILNDGKYAFDTLDHVMSMTVLRSPIYAYDENYVPEEAGNYTFMDQGIQRFTFVLLPHEGDWKQAGTIMRAAELNQRPITVIETYHEGSLPQQDSYISVDKDNIIVSAMKMAEDNDDLIIRCYETNQEATLVIIELPKWNRVIKASFAPCEIKTFRIPLDPAMPVEETDFLELPCLDFK
jgi:alpha-mannosidase